ncbi:forkhead box protein K2-like [Copidosoma floridanum]|uniref:forkhead box protein K2-like n=1 Tax=Copidosoma floridanum TaxID=29053 RepID=UPI000C6F64E4|nr:forkhead box protein K2-like [Copidosoma floridanum]
MAPDRPDAAVVDDGRDLVVGGGPCTVARVFGFCEAFAVKEAEAPQPRFVEETMALSSNEVVIGLQQQQLEESAVAPMVRLAEEKANNGGGGTSVVIGQSDDELTSLSWLHQQNLLKGLEISDRPAMAAKISKGEVVVKVEDSFDTSENTNSVSSLDDSFSHESNGRNSSVDSTTILNYDEVVINGVSSPTSPMSSSSSSSSSTSSPQLQLLQKSNDASCHNGVIQASPSHQAKFANGSSNNNNNNNSNSANYNLPVHQSRSKHPSHFSYDPQLHKNCKPPYSFSSLIFMAIEDSPVKALPVKEIYAWILAHFPYFRNAPTGWKNSVRHNLSLNKCFRKVEKSPHLGKGSLWMVDAQYRPNLLQALSRTPCPPPSVMNMNLPDKVVRNNVSNRLPDPVLFPYLSKRLASSSVCESNSEITEFDSDVDAAAATMLSFKHGPIIINHNKNSPPPPEKKTPVITRNSNEDHTYSLITSVRLERREVTNDIDEQRQLGADALLNLAGVTTTPLRDPLALDETEVKQRVEEVEGIHPDYMHLYGTNKNAPCYLPGSDPLEIRPPKRRSSGSSGDGSTKRRKRFWKNTWTENGRYSKQIKG